jgi:hypothetical protein
MNEILQKIHEMNEILQNIHEMERKILSVLDMSKKAVEFLIAYHGSCSDLTAKNFAGNYVDLSIFLQQDLTKFQGEWEPSSDSASMLFEFLITSLLAVPLTYFSDPRKYKENMIDSFIGVVEHLSCDEYCGDIGYVGDCGGNMEIYRKDIRDYIFIDNLSWKQWGKCEDSDVRKRFFNLIVHKIVGSEKSVAIAKESYDRARSLV